MGRADELAGMQTTLDAVIAGSAGALAITGEPGIGKSRLLGELCARAATEGVEVLTGRGSEIERELPYGLVVDALDGRFRALEPTIVEELGQSQSAELAAVLPSMSTRGEQLASSLDVERFEFHRAVRATFARLVRDRPLMLALDDVHWADPASVELIGHLLRHPVPGMALALAYRLQRIPKLLLRAIEEATRDGLLHEMTLAPLTIEDAAGLLNQDPQSSSVRCLYRESGGNPFYLEQLAKTTKHEIATKPPRIGRAGIPDLIRATVDEELAALPSRTLEIFQAAAVAGDPFDVDLVAEIVAFGKYQVLECIDSLTATGLVRATDIAGQFRFRHPIVRRVVYDGAMPGWRLGTHKRAAFALAGRGASLTTRAHHIERSATVGDEKALATLTEAGHTVLARAPAAAARYFEAALRLLPENSGRERRLPLVVSLADALASVGRLHESRTALEQALELLPSDSDGDRVRIIGMIARADHGLGRAEEARTLITAALEQASEGSADAVALGLELAHNRLMMHQWGPAVEAATEARMQAQALGDPALLLAATCTLAWFVSFQGATTKARSLVDIAAAGMDARDVALTPLLLEALADLVFAEMALDRFRAANRHAERGLRVSRATGHAYTYGRFTLGVTTSKLHLGHLHDAQSAAHTAIEAARCLENDQLLSAAETLRCWVETTRGDMTAALAAGRAAVRAADRQPDATFAWLAHACYGDALLQAGEHERGRQEILSVSQPGLEHLPPITRPFWYQALVMAELSTGRIDAAETLAQRVEEAPYGQDSPGGSAHYARARIHLARGDFLAATECAHRAVQCFDAVEMRVWVGRCWLLAGQGLRHAGKQDAALSELELAYGILRDAGAERLRDEAAKELRALGKRVRRQPTGDQLGRPPMLTDRESEIAELVVQGFTNREIASELFVSPKTVEKHLARIFTKLNVSTRAAVAAALGKRNIDP